MGKLLSIESKKIVAKSNGVPLRKIEDFRDQMEVIVLQEDEIYLPPGH